MKHNDRPGNVARNWRFYLFVLLLAVGSSFGIHTLGLGRGTLAGFDVAAAIFLLACVPLLSLPPEEVRKIAPASDANRALRLAISLLLAVVVFAAMTAQIVDREELDGADKALIAATLVLVWTFANTIYALHYAHLYYSRDQDGGDSKGLVFPGGTEPDLADFAYFAFTLGVAVQTADVAVSSPRIRRVVTLHAIIGFFFNIGVLSLSIGLLGAA